LLAFLLPFLRDIVARSLWYISLARDRRQHHFAVGVNILTTIRCYAARTAADSIFLYRYGVSTT